MRPSSQQIGQSQKAKLLAQISKQLEKLTSVIGRNIPTPVVTSWAFTPGSNLNFPTTHEGYTLYTNGFTNNDDGQSTTTFPLAGYFYTSNGIADNESYLSTNGYIFLFNSGFQIYANQGDLFLTPGAPLNDGDIQNFWYQNTVLTNRWKTSILVYCGHCCGSPSQQTPYSYILNLYRDGNFQYIETVIKDNIGGPAGPNTLTESASIQSQVWRSDLNGSVWTYLGFGKIE